MSTIDTANKRPGILYGIGTGALIALAVIAVFFAANAVFRLPLLPINVMDWLPNNLPNGLLNAGKDVMVSVLTAISPNDVDGVAKTAEGLIGTATLFGIIVVAVAAVFVIARGRSGVNAGTSTGVIAGVLLGILFALMYFSLPVVQFERANLMVLDGVFIVGLFTLAGFAAGRVFDRLSTLPEMTPVASNVSAQELNRRQFLVRVGGATATLTAAGAIVSLLANNGNGEPAILPRETVGATPEGQAAVQATPRGPVETVGLVSDLDPAPGTRPEMTPLEQHYRIDIVARPPEIDALTWTLPMVGLVNSPQNLTLDDIRAMPPMSRIVTMSCISNTVGGDLISTTKWTGVKMKDVVKLAQPTNAATYLKITCADGFDEYVSLALINNDERIMLAYAWDDRPLLQKHGFPVRIHIPNHYGMKQPKWITNIEFVSDWQEGYWVRRGWSESALVQHTSVIDTVATLDSFESEGVTYVPIGGIAFAGDRGISTVEVRVDGGEWTPAAIKTPISDNTWYLWRYDWPFTSGAHAFEVRCVDGKGTPQRTDVTPQRPDGATGIHRVSRIV